jgi:hypothetical protein
VVVDVVVVVLVVEEVVVVVDVVVGCVVVVDVDVVVVGASVVVVEVVDVVVVGVSVVVVVLVVVDVVVVLVVEVVGMQIPGQIQFETSSYSETQRQLQPISGSQQLGSLGRITHGGDEHVAARALCGARRARVVTLLRGVARLGPGGGRDRGEADGDDQREDRARHPTSPVRCASCASTNHRSFGDCRLRGRSGGNHQVARPFPRRSCSKKRTGALRPPSFDTFRRPS